MHRGKPLSYWLAELQSADSISQQAAVHAVQAIGPPAIPELKRTISQEASGLHRSYRAKWMQLPRFMQRQLPRPESRDEVLDRSMSALALLGDPGVAVLLPYLRSAEDNVRLRAAVSLLLIPEAALPHLQRSLEAADPGARKAAVRLLGIMGRQGRPAAPRVTELAQADPSGEVRAECALALQSIDSGGVDVARKLLSRFDPAPHALPVGALRLYTIRLVSLLAFAEQPGRGDSRGQSEPGRQPAGLDSEGSAVFTLAMTRRLGSTNEAVRAGAAATLDRFAWEPLLDLLASRAEGGQ
jgi:hypothetical protein